MSYADWGPPPDRMSGPVVLVGGSDRFFTGCEQVAEIDDGYDWDNDEQGVHVSLCTGPARPWSRMWGELRHFY